MIAEPEHVERSLRESSHSPLVAMLVRNTIVHDARVRREAGALAARGYRVALFGLMAGGLEQREQQDGVEIHRMRPEGGSLAILNAIVRAPRGAKVLVSRLALRLGPLGLPLWLIGRGLGVFAAGVRRLLGPARAAATAWRFQSELVERLLQICPNVIHCHDFNTLWAGYAASRRVRVPFVYDAHELYAHQNYKGRTAPLRRRLLVRIIEGWTLRNAAAVITVNDSIADYLVRRYRVARPVVVRNVPDPPARPNAVDIPEVLRSPGCKLLYLGGITRGRGIVPTIRALRLLPDARLVLMGPVMRAEYAEEFRRVAAECGVTDRVVFLPPVTPADVGPVAAHATIGLSLIENVCLSYYLSLPNKIFECLHAGLPVVASDFPEMRAVVEGFGVGRVCDPHDPPKIAAAIREVIEDPSTYAGMRAATRAAAAHFTWEKEAARLLELYERLVPAR